MALFGKKMSLDDLLKAIDGLSDEDKMKLKEKLGDVEEVEEVEETPVQPEEQAEKPEKVEEVEEVEETPEEPVQPVEEPVQEPTEEQPEEQPIEQPEMTDDVDEQEKQADLDEKQGLKIQALEERLAQLEEKLQTVIDAYDNRDFGARQFTPDDETNEGESMGKTMRGYAGKNARNYY